MRTNDLARAITVGQNNDLAFFRKLSDLGKPFGILKDTESVGLYHASISNRVDFYFVIFSFYDNRKVDLQFFHITPTEG